MVQFYYKFAKFEPEYYNTAMKGQVKPTKYTGEERVRSDGGNLFKKFFENAKKPPIINSEAIKSANKVVASEAKTELNVILNQVFGVELSIGKPVSLFKKEEQTSPSEKTEEKAVVTAEHNQYFAEFKRNSESKKTNEDTVAIRQQLEMILAELRKLKDSSDELETVFKDVVIDEVPEKPGIYHLTFYEGFLKLVMKMRAKVQDGVVYAKLFKSRKQERSYHAMAKKGGTSFTMHQDRAVATQTG
jgi:hypothetical protein